MSDERVRRGVEWFDANFNGIPDSEALVRGILEVARHSVSVKHLKWSERQKNGDTTAQSVVGEYSVGEVHGHHMVMLRIGERDIRIARVAGFEEAKVAAQSDYERRILSALE